MLGITRRDRKTNEWIRAQTKVEDVIMTAKKMKWKWNKYQHSHLMRNENTPISKQDLIPQPACSHLLKIADNANISFLRKLFLFAQIKTVFLNFKSPFFYSVDSI